MKAPYGPDIFCPSCGQHMYYVGGGREQDIQRLSMLVQCKETGCTVRNKLFEFSLPTVELKELK